MLLHLEEKNTVNSQLPSLPFSPRERETPEGINKANGLASETHRGPSCLAFVKYVQ